jgi:hypothetical protein
MVAHDLGLGRRAGVALCLALSLAACARDRVKESRSVARSLEGQPVGTLYACAGKPDQVTSSGGGQRLSYVEGPGVSDYVGADDPTVGIGATGREARRPATGRWCRMDVQVRDGVIETVRFSGNTGSLFGRGAECASLLRACGGGS